MTNIQFNEQVGGRGRGRGMNPGRGRGSNWTPPSKPIWHASSKPIWNTSSKPIFYPSPIIHTMPIYDNLDRVITVQKEVTTKAFEIKLQTGDYCGRSGIDQSTRNICDSGMFCDNDNKCITYREDLNVPEMKNREYRLCKNNTDVNCISRTML